MGISDIYNSIFKPKQEQVSGFQYSWNNGPFASTTEAAGFPRPAKIEKPPMYKIPKVIPVQYHPVFIEQARMAGLTPEEFGQIALREQGPSATSSTVQLTGLADPTDRGVMQINKLNEPEVQKRFKKEFGRTYNPDSTIDSIIGARMILEINREIFNNKRINQTYTNPYTNQDLIDSYNLGVDGLIQSKRGNPEKVERLTKYRNAELGI